MIDIKGELIVGIVIFLFGFFGGIITTLTQGWVADLFKKQEANRNRAQRIIDKIGGVISKVYNFLPLKDKDKLGSAFGQEAFFYQSADQLEALGHYSVASDIREFYGLWRT